jgi:hypothetical protein
MREITDDFLVHIAEISATLLMVAFDIGGRSQDEGP